MKKPLVAIAWILCTSLAQADSLPLIDVHAHFQTIPYKDLEASYKTALATMDRLNIAKSLLMPPPFATSSQYSFYDIEDILFTVKANPDRFAAMGGGSLNVMIHNTAAEAVDDRVRAKFRKRAQEIVALGAVGFGEIAILHVSIPAMGPKHAYEMVPADHPLLLLLADIAAESNIPIDLHFDLVPEDMPLPAVLRPNALNPATLQGNLPAFKRFLAHNPKTKIVWSHVGFEPLLTRPPSVVREMLQTYPNLYMSFRLNRSGPKPAATLDADGKLKPLWLELIQTFPDRFMLGGDSFYAREGIARGSSEEGLRNLRSLIEQLPEDVGRKVASENAIRVYRLQNASPI